MTDYVGALEKALYDRLRGQVTLATVFQHVPDRQLPPVTILSDVDWENMGDKDAPLLRCSVTVTSIVTGRSRKPLNALQAQVFAALDRWTAPATTAVLFGEVTVETGTSQEIVTDSGMAYIGQQSATCWVQDAD